MSFQFESIIEHPRHFVLETDIGADCDDAGCLAVLFDAMQTHKICPDAIINSTALDWGCGAIDAIASYYGASGFALGQSFAKDILADPFHHKYDRELAENFSAAYRKGQLAYGEAIETYLRVLHKAPPKGVVLVCVGPQHLLATLWKSASDLVREKVYAVVCMGGIYVPDTCPFEREYNFYACAEATKTVFESYPCPIICLGWELGTAVPSGFSTPAPHDPVWQAYKIHTKGKMQRSSWDPLTVLFALHGESDLFELSEAGFNRIREDGSNEFCPDPAGNHYYIKAKRPYRELTDQLNCIFSKERNSL